MALVSLDKVIELLVRHDILKGNRTIPPRKPGHGPCCTCQKCGFYHDECVCEHNEIIVGLFLIVENQWVSHSKGLDNPE